MIGYAADERARWISGASDVELTRAYYDICGSDIVENVAMADVLRGEMVRRFMMRSLEEEHIRRWKGVERIV
jgi:hypothetical protein